MRRRDSHDNGRGADRKDPDPVLDPHATDVEPPLGRPFESRELAQRHRPIGLVIERRNAARPGAVGTDLSHEHDQSSARRVSEPGDYSPDGKGSGGDDAGHPVSLHCTADGWRAHRRAESFPGLGASTCRSGRTGSRGGRAPVRDTPEPDRPAAGPDPSLTAGRLVPAWRAPRPGERRRTGERAPSPAWAFLCLCHLGRLFSPRTCLRDARVTTSAPSSGNG